MKKALFLGIILIFSFVLVGCFDKSTGDGDNLSQKQNIENEEAKEVGNLEPKKFYPDNNQLERQEIVAGSEFVVTQELELKFYLVEKYNPGICYGMPGPVPSEAINGMIVRNPDLAKLIRAKYGLTSDLDVYNKIKQLNGFLLTKLVGGKYKFNFTDGQCCVLTAYEGEINIIGKSISDEIIKEETKQNPC